MKLSDRKLQHLKSLQSQGGFWYITKQNLVFVDLCYMAKMLEEWNDDNSLSYEKFFNAHKELDAYGGLDPDTAHRATKNCEYIGLLYSSGRYSAQNLTPYYHSLKKICNGDFNRLKSFPTLINRQLERMFVDSASSSVYNVTFKINPFMFIFKILLLIGDITQSYKISFNEFKLFVATAQNWNEYFEVVESIIRYRNDSNYKQECDLNKSKVSDVRYNILAQNHSQIEIVGNEISIKDGEVKSVRKKVAEYELNDKVESSNDVNEEDFLLTLENLPIQQITYGAPGTGKSHKLKETTKGQAVIRTTFHPDSDYSTFVGAYKPTMNRVRKSTIIGQDEKEVKPLYGNSEYESKIQYSFVKQAFLKAYLGAWKKYTDSKSKNILPQFLIIEEINRGNCAQVFGDLFQLLDRQKNNFSSYPIEADSDLQQEIEKAFAEEPLFQLNNRIEVDDVVEGYSSNYTHEDGTPYTLSEDIQSGRVLLLPSNLYIWATMNTSDQSLFPIDSAFKRRWDWEYVRISEGRDQSNSPLGWYIDIKGNHYDWWSFINKINERVGSITSSEDKKLGYFFCQAEDKRISAEKLVSKVCFYLWNDVFKDFGFGKKDQSSAFKKADGKDIGFDDFYVENPSTFKAEVNESLLEEFVQKLEVETVAERQAREQQTMQISNEQIEKTSSEE